MKRSSNKCVIALAGLGFVGIVLMVCLYLAVYGGILWAVGSVGVSGIKAVSKDCGKVYPIEDYYFKGDWFCAVEKK